MNNFEIIYLLSPPPLPPGMDNVNLIAYKTVRFSVVWFMYSMALYPKDTYPGEYQVTEGCARQLGDPVPVPDLQLTG